MRKEVVEEGSKCVGFSVQPLTDWLIITPLLTNKMQTCYKDQQNSSCNIWSKEDWSQQSLSIDFNSL